RYFDLLVLLVANRHRVVTRQEIFDRVWAEVVVSDGALSQAVRTLRRTLGDDSREPRFIRTVSRHGYQFVAEVRETPDDGPMGTAPVEVAPPLPGEAVARPAETEDSASADWDVQLARLLRRPPFESARDEERREAAEALHALGTADAL